MKECFLPTDNVEMFNDICSELEGPQSLIGPSMAIVTGPAGRGKSESSKKYAVNGSSIYIAPMITTGPLSMLQKIAFELSKNRPGRKDGCIDLIYEEMKKERRLIIIDEADLLDMKVLELLRNLNELCSVPILLIGENELKRKIDSRSRLRSRVRRRMEFNPITQPNIVLFFRKALALNVEGAVVPLIHRYCDGDWRPVLKIAADIERAIAASGIKEVPEDLVRAIIEKDGKK